MSGTLTDVYTEIRLAILDDATLSSLVGERVYAFHARPAGDTVETMPAIHFGLIDETISETGLRRQRFQFSIITAGDLMTAWAISDALAALFHGKSLYIEGFKTFYITREGSVVAEADEYGVLTVADDYTVSLKKL